MLLDDTTLDVLKRCSQSLQAVRRKGGEREGVTVEPAAGQAREPTERKPAAKP